MRERFCGPLAAAVLLLVTSNATEAEARAATHAAIVARVPHQQIEAPRSFARSFDRRNGLVRRRDLNRDAVAAWPYPWFPDSAPAATEAPAPQVIVLSTRADGPPARPVAASLPDYGYVAGCHAIQNGYHCDIPRKAPPSP